MSKESIFWLRVGAAMGFLAVIFGAFAAHGLEEPLIKLYGDQTKKVMGVEIPATQKYLADFKTGAEYQMYHALAIIALALVPVSIEGRSRDIAGWSFLLGILLFSGSLYVLVLTGQTKLGMITPLGGVFFLIGWVALGISAFPSKSPNED
ncbi:DUF423 domain-containing protein [Thalassoglobus polymorphus]|uniref:DUF423 domain-containing protein n=1 Tax=Thalassoglobus polymorphus TaxID=2527994 RepID=A0A517QJN0_9PLAN|nr:DUF423 domain-containing protein [Thalassoglobus polymorphus]QDT31852.1 hypothetical protein Mal48_10880 [Thalassoglobus polymorphus]